MPEVVERYSPALWIHPTERYWPMDASDFVARSSLRWNRRPGCTDTPIAETGRIDASRLGVGSIFNPLGPYREHPTAPGVMSGAATCQRQSVARAATEQPRPATQADEGFVLNLADDDRRGKRGRCRNGKTCTSYRRAPVYFQYAPGRFITYWHFYGFSAPFRGWPASSPAGHEGDWERISVRLDAADRATEVAFYQHSGEPSPSNGQRIGWDDLTAAQGTRDGHPVVFVARGSHASYPAACRRFLGLKACVGTDRRAAGARWTASGQLRDVTREPWYGFAGAWGQIHPSVSDFSGPAGPGPNGLDCRKPAAPRAWLPNGTCG